MDKPLWKDANFATFLNGCFYGQKRLVFYIDRHQTLFLGERNLKRNIHEILNFSPKPWTNHLSKMQNLRLFQIDVFMVK